jgi:protein farnesyltransferase subunit beta
MPHAATSYAAVLALCILATSGGEASGKARTLMRNIRIPLYRWMVGLLQPETGAYPMHTDGEVDVRASYTIVCCATLLGVATPILCQDRVVDFIRSCQTFEGGLGGEPWSEAHGGYTFCGKCAGHISL